MIQSINMEEKQNNIAFIDGQNLHLGTTLSEKPWKVKLSKFRIYLEKKYNIKEAYYFLGYVQEINQEIYSEIQKAGFILVFKQHNPVMLGKKKGNVDTDIVFEIMKKLYRKDSFEKIVLVSGDGDYKLLVDFLIEEKKFDRFTGKLYSHRENLLHLCIRSCRITILLI